MSALFCFFATWPPSFLCDPQVVSVRLTPLQERLYRLYLASLAAEAPAQQGLHDDGTVRTEASKSATGLAPRCLGPEHTQEGKKETRLLHRTTRTT